MLTPEKYQEQKRARNERALKDGWSLDEIDMAYKIRREGMRVSYIDNEVLLEARKQLNQLNNINK